MTTPANEKINGWIHSIRKEILSQDPIHGYIPFSPPADTPLKGETASERDLIDAPFVQRLRHIHQLQFAWMVYPSAEHSRFTHVLGTMKTASVFWKGLKESFYRACDEAAPNEKIPSPAYIESLLRIAGLLHDVGHGPFSHFFDDHFLYQYRGFDGRRLTHETLGAAIIKGPLANLIREIRRNPDGNLEPDETLNPDEVAFLIIRPTEPDWDRPLWLRRLRTLFSGIYTIDNIDYVLRDAWITGFSSRAFDLERLLHYSFFSPQGLTIHSRGLPTLIRFLSARAELIRSVYYHRTICGASLLLADLFQESGTLLYPFGNPIETLDEYLRLTEDSLLTDVGRWDRSTDVHKRRLAPKWRDFLDRRIPWRLAAERTLVYRPEDRRNDSIFASCGRFEREVRSALPADLKSLELRFDIAHFFHRPNTPEQARGENFLYDETSGSIQPLEAEELYRSIPQCTRICRIYAQTAEHAPVLDRILGELTGTLYEADLPKF